MTAIKLLLIMSLTLLLAVNVFAIEINDKITINGYSSFEYEYMTAGDGEGDPNGSFDADLFDLVLNIYPVNRLRIAADLTWEHGSASEDDRGNVAVEYAFGEYTVSDLLKVRAGKMFVNFGIYNEIHTAKPSFLTVKEPQSTNKNHKFGSKIRFYPRWITGICFNGNSTIGDNEFDYFFQIGNGEQENTNPYELDNNTQKSLAGRLRYAVYDDLLIGCSFYSDKLNDVEGLTSAKLLSYGLQAEWTYDNFGLEFEYVAGHIDPDSADKVKRFGYTAMIYYTISEKYTPYFRYEFLEPDRDIDKDKASLIIVGLNYQVCDGLFLKGELDRINSSDSNAKFAGNDYTEFKFAIAIGF